jgi:alkanesulfonate monooxygenase SsuD/methylene tetrahydromethanopterin reductase-like flavin-dependent oxidoreductase (luciferase family)
VPSFAVGLPNVREYADPVLLTDLAVEAESAGWDGVFLWDHIAREEDAALPATDPWIAAAAIAARTSTVRIGLMVTPLSRRRPWKVARETVALDVLSGGRFTFGVGLGGGTQNEFAAFGEETDARGRADLLDEGLEILAGLWSGERFSFSGRMTVNEAEFHPTAVQQPRIPVWVAGRWPNKRPFRRAARWDGVFPIFAGVSGAEMPSVEQFAESVEYTLAQREGDGPFDVALEAASEPGDAARVAEYAEAGLTWWVEKLGWFRGSLDEMRTRIRQGPPH